MRVFLDDVRTPPAFDALTGEPTVWSKICRTGEELIDLINQKLVTYISFDHDLGDGISGYDVAKQIEELAAHGSIPPIDYAVHSANPVGANNIDLAMKAAWRFWEWQ